MVCRYIDRIANVRWELKDLGMEHNGYVKYWDSKNSFVSSLQNDYPVYWDLYLSASEGF